MPGDSRPAHLSSHLAVMTLALVLCACATTAQGRQKITTPAPVSDVYSDAEMFLDLATIPGIDKPCVDEECELNREFDGQVQQLGLRIAAAAYAEHPELIKRISHFDFEVVEKSTPGITSNASGKIVVLRGTQSIGLNEGALAFVIAREMGHVISQHHEENTTTRIVLSVAAGLLFPAINLFGHAAELAQATTATTATSTMLATTAASSATSFLGAKLLISSKRQEQLSEADQVAMGLLLSMGWSARDLIQALDDSAVFDASNTWSEELLFSIEQIKAQVAADEACEPLPEIPLSEEGTEVLETEMLEPLEDATQEVVADTLPDNEIIPVSRADALLPDADVGIILRTETMLPALATSPGATTRQKSKSSTPERKAGKGTGKRLAGKGATSKPGKTSARGKKNSSAKTHRLSKSGLPTKPGSLSHPKNTKPHNAALGHGGRRAK